MFAMQCSIGALNDLVDAPLDAQQKPRKPIPSGLVSPGSARVVAATGAVLGLLLAAPSGLSAVVVGVGCLGLGWAYDLRLSRTRLSWLPLALALPLLPIFAWLGAAGTVPAGLLTLIPTATMGGAGLALANGLADIDRDAITGRGSAAVALGRQRAWLVQTLLLLGPAALALTIAPHVADDATGAAVGLLRALRVGGVWLGVAALAIGALLLRSGRGAIRERGWEAEAVGVACLGLAWLAGTAGSVAGGGSGT